MIVRWFSHEVADLQPVLELLQAQDPRDHEVGGAGLPGVYMSVGTISVHVYNPRVLE